MDLRISASALHGTVILPSSKSALHRALVCAALSDTVTVLHYRGYGQDVAATVRGIEQLGGQVLRTENTLTVTPCPTEKIPMPHLFCAESGTTLRFLLPVAASLQPQVHVDAAPALRARPLSPLCAAMAQDCTFSKENLPFTVTGRLRGGTYSLPGNVSSQFISGLLLALPRLPQNSRIVLTGPLSSAAYVEMTLQMLCTFGVKIQREETGFFIPGGQVFRSPKELFCEGDWSAAAAFCACKALQAYGLSQKKSGMPLIFTGLLADSLQPDRKIEEFLQRLFLTPKEEPFVLSVDQTPDLLPVLAAAACARTGETIFTDAGRLRLKESDRLFFTAALLRDLGGQVAVTGDTLHIFGTGCLGGGTVQSYGDHRLAFAAAVAAMLCKEPVFLRHAEVVEKSYPAFWDDFAQLGGIFDEQ